MSTVQQKNATDLDRTVKCGNGISESPYDSEASEIVGFEDVDSSYLNDNYKTEFDGKGYFNSGSTEHQNSEQETGLVLDLGNQSPVGGRSSLELNLDSGFFSSSTPVVHCSTTRDSVTPKPLTVVGLTEDEILSELEKDANNLEGCEDSSITETTDLFRTCIENQDSNSTGVYFTPSKNKDLKNEIPKWSILNEKDRIADTSTPDYSKHFLSSVLTTDETEGCSSDFCSNRELPRNFVSQNTTKTKDILQSDDQLEDLDETDDQLIDESPLLSVTELKLKFESLHIFSQKFRERKYLERSLGSKQQREESEVDESCEEESNSIVLLNNNPCLAFATLRNRHQPTTEEDLSCDLGLNLGSSSRYSVNTSKSDLSLNSSPLVEEVTEIKSARLAHIEDDNASFNRQSNTSSPPPSRASGAVAMENVAVNGDVGAHGSNHTQAVSSLQSDDVTLLAPNHESALNGAETEETALPHTVHMISMNNNINVYIVGTAHFSKESNEEVRKIISRVRPSDVVVELCPARKEVLLRTLEEREETAVNALSFQSIQAKIKQHDSTMVGIFYSLMVHMSLKVQKSTGLVAGGEFRAAYEACEALQPMPRVHLGDRNVLVTLKRAWHSLSVWKQLMLIFTLLWSDIDITQEEIENLKEKDVLEMLLNELRQDFPELCNVILSERDLFLASSIRRVANKCEPNSAVVAVVGIGHMKGIVKNWECAQDADIQELCRIPRKKSRLPWKLLFRLSLLSGAAFFAYRYYTQ